jgi:hypothetical protein
MTMANEKVVYKLTLKSAFDIEDDEKRYYVKTDPMQWPRQLFSIKLDIGGVVKYGLVYNDSDEIFYYEREISETEDIIYKQKFGDNE